MTEEMSQVNLNEYDLPPFVVGQKVTAVVTKIEDKQVLVEVENCQYQCLIPIGELSTFHIEKPADVVREGDKIEVIVKKIEKETITLSKKEVDFLTAWEILENLFKTSEIFEAQVSEIVKGGLIVNKGIRCFVPASMIDTKYIEDLSIYQDQFLTFKIVELDKDKSKVILSHREVVREQKASDAFKALQNVKVGQIVSGKVSRLTNFGAFVEIGDIEGLVHVSQISHSRITHPSDVLSEGQEVSVKIISVDLDSKRISLSIKDTEKGPWEEAASKLVEGGILEGTVRRLTNFGAFVEVFPGVEGLVHISQISHKHIKTPQEVINIGEVVQVKIREVDMEAKKLSLSIKELLENPEAYITDFEMPEEKSGGFQIGELFAEKFKKLGK
ncbi:MAG: rpsA [Bacillales bacterium]|jgi:small subunit ribosomal protein S1|nr:rpsA [Bacillales bacterium]